MVVKLTTIQNAANLRDQVAEWCNQWVAENAVMTGGSSNINDDLAKDRLNYFDIFKRPPFVIKAEDNQLWLCFEGVYSYWWRDWLVRIMVALSHVFPELHYKTLSELNEKFKISNCDD